MLEGSGVSSICSGLAEEEDEQQGVREILASPWPGPVFAALLTAHCLTCLYFLTRIPQAGIGATFSASSSQSELWRGFTFFLPLIVPSFLEAPTPASSLCIPSTAPSGSQVGAPAPFSSSTFPPLFLAPITSMSCLPSPQSPLTSSEQLCEAGVGPPCQGWGAGPSHSGGWCGRLAFEPWAGHSKLGPTAGLWVS